MSSKILFLLSSTFPFSRVVGGKRKRGVPYINTTWVYFCHWDWNCQERLIFDSRYVIQKIDNFQYQLAVMSIKSNFLIPDIENWKWHVYVFGITGVDDDEKYEKENRKATNRSKFSFFSPFYKSITFFGPRISLYFIHDAQNIQVCYFSEWLCWVVEKSDKSRPADTLETPLAVGSSKIIMCVNFHELTFLSHKHINCC